MRAFLQNKLWRDKAIDLLEKMGSKIHWKRLDDSAFDQEIRVKLLEESEEVKKAVSKQELIEELADVYDILDTILKLHDIDKTEVEKSQAKKNQSRGGFDGRKYVTIAEHAPGSFGEKYCLNDPTKYPEVTN